MKRLLLSGMLAILLLSSLSGLAFAATGNTDSQVAKDLAAVRQATDKYHDVNLALADGYVQMGACAAVPGLGGMGYHFIKFDEIDLEVSLTTPEILLYEQTGEGLKLVGVEYFVPYVGQPSPALFGTTFGDYMDGHEPGMPVHYDFHVWLWKANPAGIFTPFNPLVSCE